MKKIFFLLYFFLIFDLKSQTNATEIDSVQTTSFSQLVNQGNFNEIILQEKKVIEASQKIGYKKGEIKGYIDIAKILNALKRNKESLKFLEIASAMLKINENDELLAYLNYTYGINYYSLGLYSQSIKFFNIALDFANKIKNRKEREKRIYSIYDWKRSSFEFMGMMDSVYSTERKCMKSPMPTLYINIADRQFKGHNIDSAEFYINKANDLLTVKEFSAEEKSNVFRAFGELNLEKHNYGKALNYLQSSLKITQKARLRSRNLESYKLIAKAYKGLNDLAMENEYLLKYSKLNDSLQQDINSGVNIVVEKLLIKQKETSKTAKKTNFNLYFIIFIIILIGSVVVYFTHTMYTSRQKHKDSLIDKKEQELEEFKRKLDDGYKEVVQLAINSDPSFMNKFKELYPEFYNNLTSKYQNLNSNDLRFCAFLKLDFSSKEIAKYDHLSVRTVESKKYRLRKKLELSKDIDLNRWVKDL